MSINNILKFLELSTTKQIDTKTRASIETLGTPLGHCPPTIRVRGVGTRYTIDHL